MSALGASALPLPGVVLMYHGGRVMLMRCVCAVGLWACSCAAFADGPYRWTGFYVGADVGGFDARQSGTTIAPPPFGAPGKQGIETSGLGFGPTFHELNGSGALGSFHAGYNWQATPHWLFGVEGDIAFLNREVADTQAVFETAILPEFAGGNMQLTARNNWLASARARLGWISGPWMLYATGG